MHEIEESLECEGLYDEAAVVQVEAQGGGCTLAFVRRELKTRDHLGEVPTKFDLSCFGEKAEQFGFVGLKKLGTLGGDLFGGVGSAHAHVGIVVPEARDEFSKELWLFEDEAGDFVGAPDGTPVTTA